ncbi:PITH domain-containing protein GA19395-like [Saccostrea echinata]|uniref:PITH domain-containing protein GA19395-like n=1 Tax=Saccostrea echinata TaxID=191078 RepID=UPI002A813024|nr:PITH domain-containing protein GA19395-like [Saccostrea echinata]
MSGHGHSHGSGGCGGNHNCDDHLTEDQLADAYSLYTKINMEAVQCLNTENSPKSVFKPWDQRLDKERFVESDADPELLFKIPFTGNVKLKGIIVIGEQGENHPSKMRLFKNAPEMTFDDVGRKADQEFELTPDPEGTLQYGVIAARFNSVDTLTIHFPSSFGGENTKIYYIGLKGDFQEARRQEVVIATYEARPMPEDHKADDFENFHHPIS